jgi:hypothetical protein
MGYEMPRHPAMLADQPANTALGAEMRRLWAAFAYNGVAGIGGQDLIFT